MEKPKICLSISSLKGFLPSSIGFKGFEFKSKSEGFEFNILTALGLKEKFKDYDLSLHTQLSRIFSCNDRGYPEFCDVEMNILKAEIIFSKLMGIKQITFHTQERALTNEENKNLLEIVKFAKEKGVELIYESSTHANADIIINFLNFFPDIKYCLDFGHINIANKNGALKMNLFEFIEKVKDRTVHVHAHNNYGVDDTHNSLDDGDFPWQKILCLLSGHLRKIILECRTEDAIKKSKTLIEKYYSNEN